VANRSSVASFNRRAKIRISNLQFPDFNLQLKFRITFGFEIPDLKSLEI